MRSFAIPLLSLGLLCACASGGTSRPAAPTPPPPHATLAFQNIRVFDGERVLPRVTVLVDGATIVAVGPDVAVAAGVETIDGAGKTLLPGLIDGHAHVFAPEQLEQSLIFGVTTVLDMFSIPDTLKTLRVENRPERAELRSAGILATAPGGHGTEYGFTIPTLSKPDEAQAWVDARIAEGSDYIKIVLDDGHGWGGKIPTLTIDTVKALIVAAHARGKLAVVHTHTLDDTQAVIAAGADGLVHVFADVMPPDGFGEKVAGRKVFFTPTLAVVRGLFARRSGIEKDEALAPYLTPDARGMLTGTFPIRAKGPPDAAAAQVAVKQLSDAGVPILAGTDAPNPGTTYGASVHDEMALLVAAGLTPAQALRAATATPAKVFKLDDRGRIAAGLRADLLLVDGDPTAEITATRRIAGVWHAGARLDREPWRAKVAAAQVRAAAPAIGLVSDFSGSTPDVKFGQTWTSSTDSMIGGTSSVTLTVEGGALHITGEVVTGKSPASWAGAIYSPGSAPFQPTDLSQGKGISFRAKGAGTYVVMVFTKRRGRAPSTKEFSAGKAGKAGKSGGGKAFAAVTLAWSDFDGSDGSDVMAVLIGSTTAGKLDLTIDDVEVK